MRKKNRWKKVVLLCITLITIAVLILGFFHLVPEPPIKEIDIARQALAKSRDNQANIYAKTLYKEANCYFDSAMICWQKENERFILMRDYSRVVSLSAISVVKSQEAIKQTKYHSADVKQRTKQKIGTLKELLSNLNSSFSRFPLPKEINVKITKGKLLLTEGQVVFSKNHFLEAEKKIAEAEELLKSAHGKALKIVEEYFLNYTQWKSWMDQTITESRQKSISAVIVDKFAGKCFVYKNGRKTVEFEAELGKKWVGDKRHKGDNTTPEGRYRITKKKEGRATKYYKALLIDYPNDDDKKRFHAAIANGSLPHNSKIGGLIEIHGHGGKGTDWTEGCVALTDSDMDKLYKLVGVGTPVTIIGSVAPLETIIKH